VEFKALAFDQKFAVSGSANQDDVSRLELPPGRLLSRAESEASDNFG